LAPIFITHLESRNQGTRAGHGSDAPRNAADTATVRLRLLRLRGWGTMLAANAVAAHAVSASSGEGSPFKRRLLARNRIWTLIRCIPRSVLMRHCRRIARYDGLVLASAPMRRDGASARGRIEALCALRARLAERQLIQARTTVSIAEIERWLRPEPTTSELLRIRKRARELAVD